MKLIISTLKTNIKFMINKDRKLVIDTVVPTEVSEQEYLILKGRLGSQIALVQATATKAPIASAPTPASVTAPAAPAATVNEEED